MKYLLILSLLLCGCLSMGIETPDGYKAHYTRLGNQNIQGLRFERDKDGIIQISLEKQNSDAKIIEAIGALVGVAQ